MIWPDLFIAAVGTRDNGDTEQEQVTKPFTQPLSLSTLKQWPGTTL